VKQSRPEVAAYPHHENSCNVTTVQPGSTADPPPPPPPHMMVCHTSISKQFVALLVYLSSKLVKNHHTLFSPSIIFCPESRLVFPSTATTSFMSRKRYVSRSVQIAGFKLRTTLPTQLKPAVAFTQASTNHQLSIAFRQASTNHQLSTINYPPAINYPLHSGRHQLSQIGGSFSLSPQHKLSTRDNHHYCNFIMSPCLIAVLYIM